MFEGFWKSSSFDVQNAYLCGRIRVSPTKRKYGSENSESRRRFSREYYVPVGQESVQVCKKAFNAIFVVFDGRVSRALKAQANAGGILAQIAEVDTNQRTKQVQNGWFL